MTKAELIDKIAISAGISRTAAGNALNSTLENITKTLQKGQKVTLIGLAHSQYSTGRHAPAGIQRLVKRSKYRQANYRSLHPARHSKIP